MVCPQVYLSQLQKIGVSTFAGVPDSLLKDFCACITEKASPENHLITSNEGAAVAYGIGNYIATGNVPLIYLQNSGLGNIINPLLSLASPEVYGIPMIILTGWRGELGVKDEPQHVHQGRVMIDSISAMEIPYIVLDKDEDIALRQTKQALSDAQKNNTPIIIAVKKNTFSKYSPNQNLSNLTLSREKSISEVIEYIPKKSVVVSTTGMPSRELFELREKNKSGHENDFLTVGGMGHASKIALGIAKAKNDLPVFCLDGDGAALMHMGSMAIIGQSQATNFVHIILNNGVHDSVGGQPTVGFDIKFCEVASACGYNSSASASSVNEIKNCFNSIENSPGPHLIEIRVKPGNRNDLGRPSTTPESNKKALMEYIKSL